MKPFLSWQPGNVYILKAFRMKLTTEQVKKIEQFTKQVFSNLNIEALDPRVCNNTPTQKGQVLFCSF